MFVQPAVDHPRPCRRPPVDAPQRIGRADAQRAHRGVERTAHAIVEPHLAQALGRLEPDLAALVAVDIDPQRLARIRENLARVLNIPASCVGVKFKTAEKVGPVGEGRSCEAQAAVLVSRIRSGD